MGPPGSRLPVGSAGAGAAGRHFGRAHAPAAGHLPAGQHAAHHAAGVPRWGVGLREAAWGLASVPPPHWPHSHSRRARPTSLLPQDLLARLPGALTPEDRALLQAHPPFVHPQLPDALILPGSGPHAIDYGRTGGLACLLARLASGWVPRALHSPACSSAGSPTHASNPHPTRRQGGHHRAHGWRGGDAGRPRLRAGHAGSVGRWVMVRRAAGWRGLQQEAALHAAAGRRPGRPVLTHARPHPHLHTCQASKRGTWWRSAWAASCRAATDTSSRAAQCWAAVRGRRCAQGLGRPTVEQWSYSPAARRGQQHPACLLPRPAEHAQRHLAARGGVAQDRSRHYIGVGRAELSRADMFQVGRLGGWVRAWPGVGYGE